MLLLKNIVMIIIVLIELITVIYTNLTRRWNILIYPIIQVICPAGCDILSHLEWKILERNIDNQY